MPKRLGRCPACLHELIGYVEEGSNKPNLFCQNTQCRNFMTIVKPRDMPTSYRPRNINIPFRPRKLP